MYKKLYHIVQNQSEIAVQRIADRIIRSGKMSLQDHRALTYTVLADGEISDEDRRQINRLFDFIQTGSCQIVD
ncbi:MAG: hypothetical protein ACFB02_12555 [Mastigocoleus sp.]